MIPSEKSEQRTFLVVGASPQTSSMAFRDRVFVEPQALASFLDDLRDTGLDRFYLLATCDRVEVHAFADPEDAVDKVVSVFAARAGLSPSDARAEIKHLSGEPAVRHVLGVAASLLSTVPGDPQILGQFKAAYRAAAERGLTGQDLDALAQAAIVCAKRTRSETQIGERPVSLSAAAVAAGRDLHGDISACKGLLVGIGEQGLAIIEGFRSAGLREWTVMHPQMRRAEATAQNLACHVESIDRLDDGIATHDIIVTAVGDRHCRVSREAVASALRERKQRPVLILDLGLPSDTDPAIEQCEGAFRFDLGDLERIALGSRESRQAEANAAWAIVEDELSAFARKIAGRESVSSVVRLRSHVETMRAEVLRQAGDDADRATRMLINRLLHAPSAMLRALAEQDANPENRPAAPERNVLMDMILRSFGIRDSNHEAEPESGDTPARSNDGSRDRTIG